MSPLAGDTVDAVPDPERIARLLLYLMDGNSADVQIGRQDQCQVYRGLGR
jgi:hypothetical protein